MTVTMTGAERRVVGITVASRVGISLVAVATSLLVVPYDTSGRLLMPNAAAPLAAFSNWDGVYFARIAMSGYDYEHFHAFFPLYPLLVRYCSYLLPFADQTAVPIAGWIISNGSFVLAALYLYRLGCLVLAHEPTSRRAAYLFCIAPSSVFMSAFYSESLMCLLSFSGMFYVETYKRRSRHFGSLLIAAILFGCASATRSNGVLLSLYIAWARLLESPSLVSAPRWFLTHWFATALLGVIAVGPQVLYFIQAIRVYCPELVRSLAPSASSFSMVETLITQDRPWCSAVIPNVSAMYMFIQREYWDVGFLRYYQWKQVPNFLLASPMLILSGYCVCRFFCVFILFPLRSRSQWAVDVAPYFAHWAFLLANALLVVHIQVTTRLLSACPPLFWAPAMFFFSSQRQGATMAPWADTRPKQIDRQPTQPPAGKAVVVYFVVFYIVGAVLFSSFYPWT